MGDVLEFKKGDQLYHPKHGMCRVTDITNQRGLDKSEMSYCLEPIHPSPGNPRFIISVSNIQEAGFHLPLTTKAMMKILDSIKGKKEAADAANPARDQLICALSKENTPLGFAKVLVKLFCAPEEKVTHGEKKAVLRSVEGIVHESAFVLGMSVQKAGRLLLRNLGTATSLWVRKIIEKVESGARD